MGWLTNRETTHLTTLRDDPDGDAFVRIFAGRALTRITKTPQVTPGCLEPLVHHANGTQP